jgi:hypothetical protein
MCVCICLYMYVCVTDLDMYIVFLRGFLFFLWRAWSGGTCIGEVCMYVCVYVCMYVCVHVSFSSVCGGCGAVGHE